jgi:hypothetical protein
MIQPTPEHLAAADAENRRWSRNMSGSFIRDMAVSGVLPWVAVFVLQHYGIPIVRALVIATLVPIVTGVFTLLKQHRVDALGAVNIGFLLASIGVSFLTGDVHVLLLKGAAITGAFSLICLGSLFAPKPLMFYLGRQFSTNDDPALIADWNANWGRPQFRKIIRLMTAVWGVGYLIEVVMRVIAAYTLPPLTVVGVSPIITYGMLALLMAWTIAYGKAMRRKYAAYGSAISAAGTGSPQTHPTPNP